MPKSSSEKLIFLLDNVLIFVSTISVNSLAEVSVISRFIWLEAMPYLLRTDKILEAKLLWRHSTIEIFTSIYSRPKALRFSVESSLHTSSITKAPISMMTELFSAIGINTPGDMLLPSSSFILISASAEVYFFSLTL